MVQSPGVLISLYLYNHSNLLEQLRVGPLLPRESSSSCMFLSARGRTVCGASLVKKQETRGQKCVFWLSELSTHLCAFSNVRILQFNPYSTLTIGVPLGKFFQVSKFSIHLSYFTFQAFSGIIILAKGILKEQIWCTFKDDHSFNYFFSSLLYVFKIILYWNKID